MDHSYPYIVSFIREPFLFCETHSTAKSMAEGISADAIDNEIFEQADEAALNKALNAITILMK